MSQDGQSCGPECSEGHTYRGTECAAGMDDLFPSDVPVIAKLRRELDDSKVVIAALLAKHCNGRAVLTEEDLTTVERGRLSVRSDPLHGTLLLTYEPGA